MPLPTVVEAIGPAAKKPCCIGLHCIMWQSLSRPVKPYPLCLILCFSHTIWFVLKFLYEADTFIDHFRVKAGEVQRTL